MVRSGESVININTGPDCIYYSFTASLFPSGWCGLVENLQCLRNTVVKWDSLGRISPFTHQARFCLMFIFLT